MIQKIKEYAKGIAGVLGFILSTGAFVIPNSWNPYLSVAISLLSAIAVIAVPNAVYVPNSVPDVVPVPPVAK